MAIACGSKHTVGLKSDGTVVAKGWADKYQLNVDRWEDIVAISAGEQYTIGLTAKGQVVKVAGDISSRLSKETKTKAIFGGPLNVIILKEDENFYGYGDNTYGQNNVGAWSRKRLGRIINSLVILQKYLVDLVQEPCAQ